MLQAVIDALGGGILKGASEIIGKFVEDPTTRAKIEAELALKEAEYRTKLLEAEVGDRESARKREMEVKDHTNRNLAYTYTFGYFAALFACWHYGLPIEGHDVFVTLLGILTAAQAAIMNYYFGSSYGSAVKTKVLDRVVNRKGD